MTTYTAVTARTARAEWSRLWSVRASWVLTGATILGVLGITALAASQSAATAPTGGSPWQLAGMILLPGLFGILVFVSVAATADHATGNIMPTLQWTPKRSVLLVARTLVLSLSATAAGVGLLAASSLTIYSFAPQLDLAAEGTAAKIGAVALVFASTSLLAVGLGLALRNTAAALVAVFALVLVLPLMLQLLPFPWVNDVIEWLPGSAALYFLLGEGPGDTSIDGASAAAVLVTWALAGMLMGATRILRSDADK